jgi:hypothetical protein
MPGTSYCTISDVKVLMTGTQGTQNDAAINLLIPIISRLVDRECEVPINYFATATQTIHYSGDGTTWLDVDDFDTVTDVKMYADQRRLTLYQMVVTPPSTPTDPAWQYYVTPHPIDSPPYNRLFYAYTWFPDPWGIGNVSVTGDRSTPADINYATAVWVVYALNSVKTGWQDVVMPSTGGLAGMAYKHGIPEEASLVFDYYLAKWAGQESPQMRENRESAIVSWLNEGS